MQPAVVIRLRPLGPWRCGVGIGQQQVESAFRSDRVYSAVTLAMQRLDLLSEWLEATALSSTPAVVFSSLFPFQGDTLFAPPPATVWPPAANLLTSPSPVFLSKMRWAAAHYVPLSATESLLLSQPLLADQWIVDSESGCLLRRDRPSTSPFRYSTRTSAAVDRLSGVSAVARAVACIEFENGSGLWGVARFADEAAEFKWGERVRGAFRLLADTGFGGHRSSGWGQASAPEFESGTWPKLLLPKLAGASGPGQEPESDSEQSSSFWLLSLYAPAPNDSVDWSSGDYRLMSRTGCVDSPEVSGAAKKAMRMVAEGSVLSVREEPVGVAVDVAPENFPHPVYRAGFALSCKLPFAEVPSRWKGPVETTPQTGLSDTPEQTETPGEAETLSPCEPATAAVTDEPERTESFGEIEVPTISAEAELDVSQEPSAGTEEGGESAVEPEPQAAESAIEPTDETAETERDEARTEEANENTEQGNDEL
ncbi:MAG: type III-A CRISPR-associated RAMP protein Csm4 [Bryobacteraceae bacterium]